MRLTRFLLVTALAAYGASAVNVQPLMHAARDLQQDNPGGKLIQLHARKSKQLSTSSLPFVTNIPADLRTTMLVRAVRSKSALNAEERTARTRDYAGISAARAVIATRIFRQGRFVFASVKVACRLPPATVLAAAASVP